jgi:hypothetical protein
MILAVAGIISLNIFNQLIFAMVKCGVLFEVRTEFLNIIYMSFGFKGLHCSFDEAHVSHMVCERKLVVKLG